MAEPPFEVHLANIILFPAQQHAKVPLEELFQWQQWRKQSSALSEERGAAFLPPQIQENPYTRGVCCA